jgi:hypothetical protein
MRAPWICGSASGYGHGESFPARALHDLQRRRTTAQTNDRDFVRVLLMLDHGAA